VAGVTGLTSVRYRSGGGAVLPRERVLRYVSALGIIVVCCGLLSASASAKMRLPFSKEEIAEAERHYETLTFINKPPIEQETEECSENVCHKGPNVRVPPGYILESSLAGGNVFRVEEYGVHNCEDAAKDEGCEAYRRERPEASYGYLAPHFKELPMLINHGWLSGFGNRETTLVFVWAWRPGGRRRHGPRHRELLGSTNPGDLHVIHHCEGEPVDCETGNLVETQKDIAVPALGVPFALERTYNSQAAVAASSAGPFGFGWSSSFGDHLEINSAAGIVTVVQANGSTVSFSGEAGTRGTLTPPTWSQASLVYTEEETYKYTLPNQETFTFNSSGRLLSESERNGNTTSVTYNEEEVCEGGCHKVLKTIVVTDPGGRKITLKVNGSGQVESATDPMGHVVKYGYEAGNLVHVTDPGESSPHWTFKYNSSHEMTEMVNGVGGKTTNEYNEAHEVVSQTSPLGQKLAFKYEPIEGKKTDYSFPLIAGETAEEEEAEDEEPVESWEVSEGYYSPPPEQETTITNESTGAVEHEHFNSEDELETLTRAAGTPNEATESFSYNSEGELTKATNGDKHTTEYGYNAAGDLTSEKNPDHDETKWEYNSTHDLTAAIEPNGEKTTIERDSHGNALSVSRPAPKSETQTVKYKYKSNGELEVLTDPLGHEWKYEYNGYGNRDSETDPEGNKRTWEYNEDSQLTATVSPRGNASGAEPAKFKTTIERDAQGRPLKVTDPLGHKTEYKYNTDGDLESVKDADKNTTNYSYNAADEPIKVKEANGDTTETEYDKDGAVTAQIDGNKHATKYKRNVLEQTVEVTDPLGHVSTEEYDPAGNLVKRTDPAKRITSYTYDPANRLTEVSYSDGKTPAVKYEYNEDGDRTKMTDGTGTTTNTYDQLDHLTETENGNKEIVKYEYNLANDQTKITYPNGKAVTRSFDKDERLEKLTDWLEHATKVAYDEDSDTITITFPSETKDVDTYTYNDADQMTDVKVKKSTETLATLTYTRDDDGQVKKTTTKGLPGSETTEATYDEDDRLTNYGSAEYKYDPANNPTRTGGTTQTFNEGDELEKAGTTSYGFGEDEERTKQTPASGPATTYSWNQAEQLTTVQRPAEGETPKIEDTYIYNGEDLRTSETINGTTNHLTWDTTELELPSILSNGTDSIIYGPSNMPTEQINNTTGTATYLHHDQAGSTRLLSGSTGTVTGKCTYGAYGTPTCEGTATTPLGYDGQYTNTDTGLIYLRAREYDPSTAQFLSVDPLKAITGEPFSYAGDVPINAEDPSGLLLLGGGWGGSVGTPSLGPVPVSGMGGGTAVGWVNPGSLSGGVTGSGAGLVGPSTGDVTTGPVVGLSNANNPHELSGPFTEVCAGGALLLGWQACVAHGHSTTECGDVTSIWSITTGPTVGLGGYVGGGKSYTVTPSVVDQDPVVEF
jgi:RHS repeat-associated protein